MEKKTVIFLHVQKASGSVINHIFRKNKNKRLWLRRKTKEHPDIVSGHIPYGIHETLKIKNYSYCILLRDPTERWKSQFYHAIEGKRHIGYALFKKCDYNLKRFLAFCLESDSSCNIITKQIYGKETLSNIKYFNNLSKDIDFTKKDFGHFQVYGWSGRKTKYTDNEMNNFLKEAKCNLQHNIDFIGFQEQGNKCHKHLARFYRLKRLQSNKKIKKTNRKQKFNWNDKHINKMLLEINRYDIELVKLARRL